MMTEHQSMTTVASETTEAEIRAAVRGLDRARASGEPGATDRAESELMETMAELSPRLGRDRVRALIVGGRLLVDVGLLDPGTDGEGVFRALDLEDVVRLD